MVGSKREEPCTVTIVERKTRKSIWANTLPRKLLAYRTPDELFDEELDRIYAL